MKISNYSTELGKYCLDISKAIAITVIIAPLAKDGFSLTEKQVIMLGAGVIAAACFLVLGLFLLNLKK